jgi:proteasome alpha subunit
MSTPYYVSPEQLMKDRADYARKGIARGRSNVVLQYADGILFVAENASKALHKISELYDRIAFAAVGRYNEFENLRVAGVRLADLTGYTYDRQDVTGRSIANAYAQTLGAIFSGAGEKPYEVEIVVAEVGDTPDLDTIYRLTYDGSVGDEHGYVAMGGQAEHITGLLRDRYVEGAPLAQALRLAVDSLTMSLDGQQRELTAAQLEVAVLDRTRPRRAFRRYVGPQLEALLAATANAEPDADPLAASSEAADAEVPDAEAPTAT